MGVARRYGACAVRSLIGTSRPAPCIIRNWARRAGLSNSRHAFYSSGTRPATTAPGPSKAAAATSRTPSSVEVAGKAFPTDSWFNVPANVLASASRRLHLQKDHPVCITREIIESVFPKPTFKSYTDFHPVVSAHENFDSLGFPADHPGRSRSDTYYINKDTLLRTHATAHDTQLYRAGESDGFLTSADVYRRDEVDRTHYPVFHQLDAARVWDRAAVPGGDVAAAVYADLERLPTHDVSVEDPNPPFHPERNPLQAAHHSPAEAEAIAAHLKRSLELVVVEIFTRAKAAAAATDPDYVDEPLRVRWVEAYFPFTSPSWELEVYYAGDWLEVLGCGVTKQELFASAGAPSKLGWAFGLGLERIAMLLFQIPDIRLFWSRDERFLSQFRGWSDDSNNNNNNNNNEEEEKNRGAALRRFVPFSKHPPCWKDVSFWLRPTSSAAADAAGGVDTRQPAAQEWHENDLMEVVRGVAGDVVEDVKLVDEFSHPKTGRESKCYRINYRSLERTLTNAETNQLHAEVTKALVDRLGVEIR